MYLYFKSFVGLFYGKKVSEMRVIVDRSLARVVKSM